MKQIFLHYHPRSVTMQPVHACMCAAYACVCLALCVCVLVVLFILLYTAAAVTLPIYTKKIESVCLYFYIGTVFATSSGIWC